MIEIEENIQRPNGWSGLEKNIWRPNGWSDLEKKKQEGIFFGGRWKRIKKKLKKKVKTERSIRSEEKAIVRPNGPFGLYGLKKKKKQSCWFRKIDLIIYGLSKKFLELYTGVLDQQWRP